MLPGVPGGRPGSWELACFALCRLHPAAGANRLSWPSRLVAAAHGAGEEVDRGRLEPGEAAGMLAATILAALADQTR